MEKNLALRESTLEEIKTLLIKLYIRGMINGYEKALKAIEGKKL